MTIWFFPWECKVDLTSNKAINLFSHINRVKAEKPYDHLNRRKKKKAFDKFQHPCLIKNSQEPEKRKKLLESYEGHLQKPYR